jgi:DNA-binding Xre family transcriptional regulator
LANKAGLSFCTDIKFSEYFNKLISLYPGKKYELYDAAQISERMYRYVKNGQFLTKETLLALAISLELKLNDIQVLLKKAGYILSGSLPNDMIIIWLIEHDERSSKKINYVSYINDVLYSLEMPLLMTRDKF